MKYIAIILVVLGLLVGSPFTASPQKLDPAFESLVDRYLAEFHDVGAGTTAVNDGSAAYYQNRLDTARGLLDELQVIDRQTLTFQQDIDYRYLKGILKTKVMDGERVRYWEKDPSLYLRIEPIVSPRGGLLYLENRPVTDRAAGRSCHHEDHPRSARKREDQSEGLHTAVARACQRIVGRRH